MLSLFGGNNSFQALEQDYLLLCDMVVYLSVNSAAYWIAGFRLQLNQFDILKGSVDESQRLVVLPCDLFDLNILNLL